MYSRNVSFKLKPKSTAEFTSILEGEIIPLLRRQRGFEDAICFIAQNVTRQSPSVYGIKKKTPRLITAGSIRKS